MNPIRLGSFYIIQGVIYYNFINDGLDHPLFWGRLVPRLFNNLPFETKQELIQAPYAVDRGRLTKFKNQYLLLGTPGCKQYELELKKIFNIKSCIVDWNKDCHYRIRNSDSKVFKECLLLTPLISNSKKILYDGKELIKYD